jgi:hypothetical protein
VDATSCLRRSAALGRNTGKLRGAESRAELRGRVLSIAPALPRMYPLRGKIAATCKRQPECRRKSRKLGRALFTPERLLFPANRSFRSAVLARCKCRQNEGCFMAIRCPHCHSRRVHRSRFKGTLEAILLAVVFLRPFRCEECDLRFFRWSTEKRSRTHRPARTS